jgi:hypothetical protein
MARLEGAWRMKRPPSLGCQVGIVTSLLVFGLSPSPARNRGPIEVFAPTTISAAGSNFAPAFARDSSFVLFTRKTNARFSILLSQHTGSEWSTPMVAPFSGQWNDLEAAMSVDGSYAIFASDRPVPGSSKPLLTTYASNPMSGGNLWRVAIRGTTWAEPSWLPASVNNGVSVWTPSLAGNGNLYFMSADRRTGRFRLHIALDNLGSYQTTGDLAFSNGDFNDVDPMIDAAERFLIFSSDRASPRDGSRPGTERLFIAFNPLAPAPLVCPLFLPGWEDGTLSQIEARLSSDENTLYFASNQRGNGRDRAATGNPKTGTLPIWMVSLQPQLWRRNADSDRCRHAAF